MPRERHKITADAIAKSREVRSARATLLLADIRNAIREIGSDARFRGGEPLAGTYAGLARQLNARGMRTNRRSKETGEFREFCPKSVYAAFDQMGVDLAPIRRWKNHCRNLAANWKGVAKETLFHQLWREWFWNDAKLYYSSGKEGKTPFVPEIIHPSLWIDPAKREPQYGWFEAGTIDGQQRFVGLTPNAQLVRAFIGAFEHEEL